MKLSNKFSTICSCAILSFFVLPIIYILIQSLEIQSLNFYLIYKSVFYVILQSVLSASFSLLMGTLIVLSYLKKSKQVQKTIYWGLLPQALPTVLIIYSYFKIFSLFGVYPQSYAHVIIVHVCINMGLVAFLMLPHLQVEVEKKLHLMLSLKLSFGKFFKLIILGELAPTILYIWILILSFSLTSFSVPLLLSGQIPSSFDYLIYLKGYVEGDWASASLLGLFEFVFLGCLFFLRTQKLTLSSRATSYVVLRDKNSIFFCINFVPLLFIFLSLLHFGNADFGNAAKAFQHDFLEILINTVFLSSWTILFYTLFFWTQLYILKFQFVRKFHQFFWPLSPILLSFVILNFSLFFADSLYLKIAFTGLAISSFIFPIAFKFWILPEYYNIVYFNRKSEILSLDYPKVFNQILVPYFKSAYKTSLAYVILFSIGDFTLSGILLSDINTIGISMRTYIQSYQIIEAQLLAIFLVIVSLVLIYVIGGVRNENS